ncbi:methylase involved in ubiquinone/menaquinone biosynthesis [Singulisphaera acidiphila DSM 18658]|uniref:Methylase involved in ubiquinone/menaquinone biosynthesis n=1 Tax=Singulisphaera acidiphila (strain ATCC BAA-1392 / DSM 18658 / VKM B-2454 / MOB10) TaxID=886293 RepID=L0DLR8_SINAD|nr:methylase involved in ubiquinone/menaquinone biosynthesis [Singulisphaera acidiphila DSM 18658]
MLSRFVEHVIYRLSMRAHSPANASELSHREATFSKAGYQHWRRSELESQFTKFFDVSSLRGRRVLDFGCGSGDLSFFAASAGAAEVIGTELSQRDAAQAEHRRADLGLTNLRIVHETNPSAIGLPDHTVDVLLCFDVLEHIMEYERIVAEWRRVLAPGGRVLIWWSVYWHPYGHHLQTMIPLPWVHALLNDEALMRVCAKIYDNPKFRPRIWHFDADGQRVENPYRGVTRFTDLNRLTIKKFERVLRSAGLVIARRDIQPFTGRRLAWLKRTLVRLRPDFFCSCVAYEITVP